MVLVSIHSHLVISFLVSGRPMLKMDLGFSKALGDKESIMEAGLTENGMEKESSSIQTEMYTKAASSATC